MPLYRYVALDAGGTQVKGALDAKTEDAVRLELLRQNLEVQNLKRKRSLGNVDVTPQRVPSRRSCTSPARWLRSCAAASRSWTASTSSPRGTKNKRFRKVLLDINEQLREGVPFADALANHTAILPPYYLGIVRTAELTGRLDTALEQLSGYIERDLEAKSKLKAALMYPSVVLLMSIVTVNILMIFVLPKFVDFFDNLGAELPLSTRMLMAVGEFSGKFWFVFPLVGLALFILFLWMKKTSAGNEVRDRMLLRMPLVKDIVLYSVIERFCRVLGAMSQAGVPIPEGMRAAVTASRNKVFEAKLQTAQERILEGEGLAEPIAATALFPRAAVQ